MMGRNLQDAEEPLSIDLSPMIDCIFILLIFFIVTTVFVEETGVKVNKPEIGGSSTLDKNSILIAVTAEDEIVYDKKKLKVQDVRTIVEEILTNSPETPVIIQGDTNAKHGLVQQVHGECKTAGAKIINVSSKL